MHRTRWMSPCNWTFRTSFTLSLPAFFFLGSLPLEPALPAEPGRDDGRGNDEDDEDAEGAADDEAAVDDPVNPTRSSSPSMFWVYERKSLFFASRVLMNLCVDDGDATSIFFLSSAIKL